MRGTDLAPHLIRYAYQQGAFPMTMEDGSVEWFLPERRAVFPIEGMYVSSSLRKRLRQGVYEIRFDTAFREVIEGCVRPADNWISPDFVRVYTKIHEEGWGHSAEAWWNGVLVGGVYGVALGSCFCAESMFYRRTDASKVALWALLERCRALGFTLFDAQVINPHLTSLGAYEISQEAYLERLNAALRRSTPWSL